MIRLRPSLLVMILLYLAYDKAEARNFTPASQFEEAFATSLVLSDSNMITFGIADFNPNRYLSKDENNPDNGLGSNDSIQLRNQMTVYSLPYTFELTEDPDSRWSHELTVRASYVNTDIDVEFKDKSSPDSDLDEIFGLYAEYAQNYDFYENWTISVGNAFHLMHYRNTHTYNSDFSQSFAPVLDGLYYNVSSNAFIIEPKITFQYKKETDWGEWRFNNSYHYAYGQGFGGSSDYSSDANPEVWRFVNSIQLRYNMAHWNRLAQVLYLKAKRVDLGGDANEPLGTDFYYEFNIAWLIDTRKWISLVDNVGIGFTFNVGSALRGGSIVLFYDE
ncbi:Solitary outer membrane autotransporter beta-barrel domain [Aliivibrio fischeri]|uniref:Solitary outer membrane autotransporter beta-barrel domain n=1 Tax=Aliivibrio fischeri TaxID=668 RepID=A0A6N3Z176_ALIFS|nr:Solitary outer membrane autotransporter beta-barrel domain [Aliivibrio fischeri]MUJ21593.1 Solitary outer membrane autotransporter beta-barrel domain [Aliivibrio fischeri]MUK32034.1 Solitary outer membrane autotransporter beta-barrel domain [Aliivibrio fischeri]MUK45777.1 Solitary outer membrane autotransporter beta-barrel domain [Aliivibrio fischeri]MUK62806.1 Solitary outer membrane autotransporter beta-barrel domain [Aliivibrio fischeri]MUK78545.1 Solitary outer membrane autotransporter 